MKPHADYRAKWLASMVTYPLCPRVPLSKAQYEAIRDCVLKGMQAYSNEEPVHSLHFKTIREAWSRLAPVQGKPRFIIDVDNER